MIQTLVVDKGTDYLLEVIFETPSEDFPLVEAIHAAAMDYCMTAEGYNRCVANGGFEMTDFIETIPQYICNSNGFSIMYANKVQTLFMGAALLVDIEDLKCCTENSIGNGNNIDIIQKTAQRFQKLYHILEESEGMEPIKDKSCLLNWAKEYRDSERRDELDFLREKHEELKNGDA